MVSIISIPVDFPLTLFGLHLSVGEERREESESRLIGSDSSKTQLVKKLAESFNSLPDTLIPYSVSIGSRSFSYPRFEL